MEPVEFEVAEEFLTQLISVVEKYEGTLVALGYDSTGVQGDAKVRGPVAIIDFPPEIDNEEAGLRGTQIINEVEGLTRVLRAVIFGPLLELEREVAEDG